MPGSNPSTAQKINRICFFLVAQIGPEEHRGLASNLELEEQERGARCPETPLRRVRLGRERGDGRSRGPLLLIEPTRSIWPSVSTEHKGWSWLRTVITFFQTVKHDFGSHGSSANQITDERLI